MSKSYLYVLGVIAAIFGATLAITDDEKKSLRESVHPLMDACGQGFGLTKEQVIATKEAGNLERIDPCFFACMFKTTGIIDGNGLFDAEVNLEIKKIHIKGEDDIANIAKIGRICTSVNKQAVSDSEKGCDRSKLIISCFTKQKYNFTAFGSS